MNHVLHYNQVKTQILAKSAILTRETDSFLIFFFIFTVVLITISFLSIKIVPLVKFLLIGDIKEEEKNLIMKRAIKALTEGKNVRLDPISEKLKLTAVNTLKLLKQNIPMEIKQDNLLVSTFPSFSLLKLPIKSQVCAICLNPIQINVYQQCMTCNRFFCLDHHHETIEASNLCPDCSGKLEFFPKCCDNCGLEFANLSQLPDLHKCPFCNSEDIISPFQVKVELKPDSSLEVT